MHGWKVKDRRKIEPVRLADDRQNEPGSYLYGRKRRKIMSNKMDKKTKRGTKLSYRIKRYCDSKIEKNS